MEFWSWMIAASVLLAAAAGMMLIHLRTWQSVQTDPDLLEPRELDYRRRQFRRRMQTSALLGTLAAAIFAGYWVELLPPWIFLLYWAGVLLLLIWLGLLAAADAAATRFYFSRVRDEYKVEEARLRYEIDRLRARQGNGAPDRH